MLYARITIEIHRMMRFYVGQVRLCDIIFFSYASIIHIFTSIIITNVMNPAK
jgi:hypothetical protein